MKKICLLIYSSLFILNSSFGQGGTWTWISGDSAANSLGVFGTQGVPSVNNHPPGFYEPCEWKDKQGNFWIYGGTYPNNSDLWKYNPINNEWTWVKGDGGQNEPPVFGTQGIPDSSNTPGSRAYCSASWIDTSGALWLFGSYYNLMYKNDLWRYDISTNEWTWMKGDSTSNAPGVHGTLGIPSSSNTPGSRIESSSAWTDSSNNLWLFGGNGYDDGGNLGVLNDLCKYDISTNEWTWMKGSTGYLASTIYGTKGVPKPSNDPGARETYTKWKDIQGNFWLMGGLNYYYACLNDLWKYDLNVNEWTWMGGSVLPNDSGKYNSTCLFNTINLPKARFEQRSAVTDNCGRFWLFAGSAKYYPASSISDLYIFDPQQLEWNWISGTNLPDQTGSFGALGITSSSNMPSSRAGAVAWWGNDHKFYMFGGMGIGQEYSDLWVFNQDTDCVPSSSCNSIAVLPPVANFQASKTTLCANDCINFTDLSTNATAWLWLFAGAIDSINAAENPQNICYSTSGTYNVKLIASNAGGTDTTNFNDYIAVSPVPPIPVITQHHDTLFCGTDTSYKSYQWFADTNLIAGATDTALIITQGGNYNIQVSNANGCKIAVGINVILGLQNYSNDNILTLSPNPTADELLVNGYKLSGNETLTIYNILGEDIYSDVINRKQVTVNCKAFSPGLYFVQVVSESGRWVGKFIKQ